MKAPLGLSLCVHALLGVGIWHWVSPSISKAPEWLAARNWVVVSARSSQMRASVSHKRAAVTPRSAPAATVSSGASDSRSPDSGMPSATWAERVRSRVQEELSYPLPLQRRGISGKVDLRLLAQAGSVEISVYRSSGSEDLDRLALAIAHRAAREVPPSATVTTQLRLPVIFRLPRP